MIKKGLTLVEMLVALSLFSILVLIAYSIINSNDTMYKIISRNSDSRINARIAMEYIIDRIMDAHTVQLQESSNPCNNAAHIRVETRQGSPANALIIDGDRFYIKQSSKIINGKQIKENIMRCGTDSQQVVPGIYAFEIWDKGSGLYYITLYMDNPNNHLDVSYPNTHTYSSYVKKR